MPRSMGTISVLQPDGHLTEAAQLALHTVCNVDPELLRSVRIRPSASNWLYAPWYPYRRGGALTIGRTIWFTGIWFSPNGHGDGSPASTLRWLLHLAHEVGHLPQAERFGQSLGGKLRYVAAFAWQYGKRAVLFRRPVHDGSPLEREADLGRQVMQALIRDHGSRHPLVAAVHQDSPRLVAEWHVQQGKLLAELQGTLRTGHLA